MDNLLVENIIIKKPLFHRIAIDGSHSTGKTTLLRHLESELSIVHYFNFLEETARRLAPQEFLFTPEDWAHLFKSQERHQAFLQRLYNFQKKEEKINHPFIIDGSLYKVLAYAQVFGFDYQDIGIDIEKVSYDLIIYCPIEIDFRTDGFRYAEHRQAVDTILRQFHQFLYKGLILEVHGSIEERMRQIIAIIEVEKPERS